jgi:fibronectin type 3 domain-containing protein
MILPFVLAFGSLINPGLSVKVIAPVGNPPAANLTWVQSTSPNIASNCVYRGTVSGGPYTLITSPCITATTSYQDTTVVRGNTYYFVVTAVNTSGVESANSNQATAVIPSINPPTNLTETSQ